MTGLIYRYICDLNHDTGAIVLVDSYKFHLIYEIKYNFFFFFRFNLSSFLV